MDEPFIAPGTGWPDDPATRSTPVAGDGRDVVALAGGSTTMDELSARVSVCRACPRLVQWREQVATTRRRAYASERYWGRPIAGWGEADAPVLVVGLAPAAHGGNRTGRIFTGDASGDFLFAALHRAGFAVQATSTSAGDGQRLVGARMLAAVRCAPPGNAPTLEERDTCAPWLHRELALGSAQVAVVLGGFAWSALLSALAATGTALPRPRPRFGHGTETPVGALTLLGCYHPSQQNTFTGRLTPAMIDSVLERARILAGGSATPGAHGVVRAARSRRGNLQP